MRQLLIAIFTVGLMAMPASANAQQSGARQIKRDRVLARAASQFQTMDTDKNGMIDNPEMDAAIEIEVNKVRARMQKRFAEMDPSGTGQISRQAFVAAREKWFNEVDANADGILDQNELKEWNRNRPKP